MALSIVVLPAPLGPIIENTSPGRTAKLTPPNAITPPKARCTSVTRRTEADGAAAGTAAMLRRHCFAGRGLLAPVTRRPLEYLATDEIALYLRCASADGEHPRV